MHKKLALITLFVVLAMIVGTVSATTSAVSENDYAGYNYDIAPLSSDYISGGHAFDGNDQYLSHAIYNLSKNAGATGVLYAYLYETSGGKPANGASVLETSSPYLVESLDTSYQTVTFTFSGTYYLDSANDYGIAIRAIGQTGHYHIADEAGAGAADCFESVSAGAAFSYSTTDEPIHYFYTETEYGTGGSGGGDWSDTDISALIDNAMEFLVPLIVILLPAILFIIFFKRTDKWLILIGLAIGVGLGYYFFNIPIWLVFLIAIGLIGMAYSEVRRNG